MDVREREALSHRIETLSAEVDALRLLVLTLMGRMAVDEAELVQAVAQMIEAAGDAMHAAEPATERHRIVAREIDSVSQLVRQVLRASRQH